MIWVLLLFVIFVYSMIILREIIMFKPEQKHNKQNVLNNKPKVLNNKEQKNPGYCYIGKNREGVRHCALVDYTSDCLSQDIYPTLEKCIHPSLRYYP